MSIRLYVDFFMEDDGMAVTTSDASITYNLFLLDRLLNEKGAVFSIGNYLCFHLAETADTPHALMFMDLKKSPELLKEILDDIDQQQLRAKYQTVIEDYYINYESNAGKVELTIGTSPVEQYN